MQEKMEAREPEVFYVAAVRKRRQKSQPPRVEGPEDLARVVWPLFRKADRELFYAVLLSTKNHVLAVELVSVGSLSASLVHPREVFKPAIVGSAAAVIAVHNHPSGDPEPSSEDREFTRRLARCGELLGIRLLDHLVFGDKDFVSFKESGLM